ncbi:uncharacterized protein C6orf141 homolog [Sorex araneus]|uniref:uncharacterized protein C6orf141 homolog n=1 Tax=Sorex araneus TaxID=42254 RepID=UPI00033147F8|nr:uncharacterized protein C6orf141 homolog [Sorex araneus]
MNDIPRLSGGRGRAGVGARGEPPAVGAPWSAVAAPSAARGGAHEPGEAGESWVREKVLFLLHPERCLGTLQDPGGEGPARGSDGDGGGLSAPLGSRVRTPDSRDADPAARAPLPDPAAQTTSVLVRVVDYQVTQEVLRSAWTQGQMTRLTEERSVTAVTFPHPQGVRPGVWGPGTPAGGTPPPPPPAPVARTVALPAPAGRIV